MMGELLREIGRRIKCTGRVPSNGQTVVNILGTIRMIRKMGTANSNGRFFSLKNARPDGRMYKGGWVNGKQDGDGTFVSPDGQQKTGKWKDGSRIEWTS
jgi:hypothetical protein